MPDDIFIHEQIRNYELLKLMHEMRQERTQEKMLDVLKLAAASSFIVPVDVKENGKVSFHAVGDKKGRRFVVAYADSGSFETSEQSEDRKGVKASFEDLMEVVLSEPLRLDGMIINPGAAEVIFGKELINSIKGQMNDDAESTVDMQVHTPSEYPPELKPMIAEFCRDESRISGVYVKLLATADRKMIKWLIGIDTSAEGEEKKYLLDTFGRFIRPALQGTDVIVAGTDEDYVKQAVGDAEPFYERA